MYSIAIPWYLVLKWLKSLISWVLIRFLNLLVIFFIFGFYLCLELTRTTGFISCNNLIKNTLENSFYLTRCLTFMAGWLGCNMSVLKYIEITFIWTFKVILMKTGTTGRNGHKLLWFTNSYDWHLKYVLCLLKYRENHIILAFYLNFASTIMTGCSHHNRLFLGDFSEYFGIFLV